MVISIAARWLCRKGDCVEPVCRLLVGAMSGRVVGLLAALAICALALAAEPAYGQQLTSARNVFGGLNFSDGTVTMPNVFGGMNISSPSGASPIVGIPNVFGGMNFGSRGHTTSNVFGGQNLYSPQGGFMSTTPNVFGGSNFSAGGYTTPNAFGGFNHW